MAKGTSPASALLTIAAAVCIVAAVGAVCRSNSPFEKRPPRFEQPSPTFNPSNMGE